MVILLELTEREIEYLTTCCFNRVLNSALEALPPNYDYLDDMEDARWYETLRNRICNEIFKERTKESR